MGCPWHGAQRCGFAGRQQEQVTSMPLAKAKFLFGVLFGLDSVLVGTV